MLQLLDRSERLGGLVTLTVLEIVLGIDNIVFIGVLIARLPARQKARAAHRPVTRFRVSRRAVADADLDHAADRAGLHHLGNEFSWRDLILIGGGLFLIAKGTSEIHSEVEAQYEEPKPGGKRAFMFVLAQLVVIDLVFSLDSIITAIGLAQDVEIMIAAVLIAMLVMYFAAVPVSAFIQKYPTTKMLALSFLLLIGVALVADGLGFHIPRGYIYFAMAFAGAVEVFNVLAMRNRRSRPKALTRSDPEMKRYL